MNDIPPEGRGFNADDLHHAQLAAFRERLFEQRPDLLALGRRVMLDQLRAERDASTLRAELHKAFGGDGVRSAIAMLTTEATALLKAEETQAAKDREQAAIDAATVKRAAAQAAASVPPMPTASPAKPAQQSQARR
jgi:hypothetical protein